MSFARLDELCRKLEALDHAEAMLQVDEAVNMPAGGGEKRAEAMGTLAAPSPTTWQPHPQIDDWIAAARTEDLDPAQQSALARVQAHASQPHLPLGRFRQPQGQCADPLRAAVAEPARQERLGRLSAGLRERSSPLPARRRSSAPKCSVSRPMMRWSNSIDPGSRSAEIATVFADLKRFLNGFIPEALEAQARRRAARPAKPFHGDFPPERQKMLGLTLMKAVGFDFDHGRLDISHHPFCGGVPSDVRMTTRYTTDEFLSSLMGILHETGHGLYEQGPAGRPGSTGPAARPAAWPCMKARACSRRCRSRAPANSGASPCRWRAIIWARSNLPASRSTTSSRMCTKIEKGYIRVDADEVTYPLHVILRFEIEKDLIEGRLAAKDVPEAWDAKMRDYLGLSTIDNSEGRTHAGRALAVGRLRLFPELYAGRPDRGAAMRAAMERDMPDLGAQIAPRRLRGHQRLAPQQDLAEGLDGLDRCHPARGHRRRPFGPALRGPREGGAISKDQARAVRCPRCRMSCATTSSASDVISTTVPTALISGVTPRRIEENT